MTTKFIIKIVILLLVAALLVPMLCITLPQHRSLDELEYVSGVCIDYKRVDMQSNFVGGIVCQITMDNGETYSVPEKMLDGITLKDLVGEKLSFYSKDAVLWYEKRIVAWDSTDLIKTEHTLKEENRSNIITFVGISVIYLLCAFLFLLTDLLKLWQKISVAQDKKWDLIKKEANRKRHLERQEKYEAKVKEYETEAKFYHAQKNTSKKKLKNRKKK